MSHTEIDPRNPAALAEAEREYTLVAGNRLSLDLSRGKPAAEQLDLSRGLEDALAGNYRAADGTDVRNYGGLRGLPEARELGARLMDAPAANVIAGGNSSLTLMHLVVSTALTDGLWGDERRWGNVEKPKLLAPVPGYDRHFTLSEALGVELVTVPMTDTGPAMDEVARLAAADASVKGIWCVPKYANPTGATYDDATVEAMAELPAKAAADDFVVLWDNAYAVHHIEFPGDELASLYDAGERAGTGAHLVQFASTSKITYAGAGIAFVASHETVLAALERQLGVRMICPDKLNQLRHARFLGTHLDELMRQHGAILKPKFDLVQKTLDTELAAWGARWTRPNGGYFVSLDLEPGLASTVVTLAREVGLTLTPAGATYPYGRDPHDSNIRIAPTFATLEELAAAMQVLTLCVKLATLRKHTARKEESHSP